ncbi:MAG: AAA family ATPase [Prevotellaceae bacterium]|nr:AAA family ATPase [Prevotellaceae bacterium]
MEIAKSAGMPQVYQEKGAVLQQIFYGAPGTGKSHAIKERTEAWEKRDRVVRTTFHPDSDYSTFVGCYKPTTEELVRRSQDDKETTEKVISYDFVGQAFLSAYVDAWKDRTQPEFLVIEEINRGNCAQIFGDLFQLLDRGDDGYSEYAIRADKDLQKYLEAAFKDVDIADYPKVKAGTELLLPSNLRIWATMNTSDQSLFPIDSAFKRRWDWKYIPIAQGEADGGKPLDWRVEAGVKLYDWWDFLKEINKKVFDTTNSADKQMGFFFCKAKDGVISAETFVSKVVFYLWNDVFKDCGFDDQAFNDGQAGSEEKLSFDKFYDARGEVIVAKIQRLFENLKVKAVEE